MSKLRSAIVPLVNPLQSKRLSHMDVSFALFLSKLLIKKLPIGISPNHWNPWVLFLPGFSNPGIRRVVRSGHRTRAACERIQVINVISMSTYNRVINLGNKTQIDSAHG